MYFFIQQTVENLQIFTVEDRKQREAAQSHIREAAAGGMFDVSAR